MIKHIITIILILLLSGYVQAAPQYNDLGDLDFWPDLNWDGYINITDLALFTQAWLDINCPDTHGCLADIYPLCGDSRVDIQDYAYFSQQWLICTDPT